MFLMSLLVAGNLAHAVPFEKMVGTYEITNCQNRLVRTSGHEYCKFSKLSIGANHYGTSFHFFTVNDTSHSHEVSSFPVNPDKTAGYNYREVKDRYAIITNHVQTGNAAFESNTSTSLEKIAEAQYILRYFSEMPGLQQRQDIVMSLTKVSDLYEPAPKMPPDPEDPDALTIQN